MDDTWESNVSPLMMGVGIGDIRGMGDMQQQQQQPSCSGQDMAQDINSHHHHHQDMQPNEIGQDLSTDMQDLDQDLSHSIQQHPHHQSALNHNNYYGNHQLLVSGQPTTTTISGSSPVSGGGGSSLSPGGSASVPDALSPGGGANSNSATGPPTTTATAAQQQCCESGRPLVTDPVTGQSVCSCQYDSARLAALQYPRSVGVYGTPYPSTDQNPYPSIGVESSAFYSPLGNPYALKEAGGTAADMSAWTSAGLQPTTGYYPYDPALAAYGYSTGYDLAARRKNATRESTATLKAWLNEHKKNPYPTKGEKIMLAIITKMTLTQVSTWFANARRRLKKENKMTWEPKNKTDDDDDALVSDNDEKDKDDDDKRDETDIHGRIKSERNGKDLDDDDIITDDDRKDDILGNHMHHLLGNSFGLKPEMKGTDCGVPLPPSKPKIWSLADTAACKTPPPPPPSAQHQHQQHQQQQHHQQQQQWLGSSNGFALPSSRYGGGGAGFLPSHCHQQGFPDVQTDTPPQTPPNMKLPAGNLSQQGPCIVNGGGGGTTNPNNYAQSFIGGFGRIQSPHRQPQNAHTQMVGAPNDNAAAFKPFYKSPQTMNGGFVSPV